MERLLLKGREGEGAKFAWETEGGEGEGTKSDTKVTHQMV